MAVCGGAAALLVGGAQSRSLTTHVFAVTTTADTVDNFTGDGICADASSQCSLRAAVQEADQLGGSSVINVPAGTYTLSLGQLLFTANISLVGAGARTTSIIQGGVQRVIEVSAGTSSISGVLIQGGDTLSNSGEPNEGVGGGIWVDSPGTLSVSYSTITHNVASASGGGIDNNGTLSVDHSTIEFNGAGTIGGGIDDFGPLVTVNDSTISNNSAGTEGGGLLSANTTTLTNDTFGDNRVTTPGGPAGDVFVYGGADVKAVNTIFGSSPFSSDCNAALDSLGSNLASDASCVLTAAGDHQGVDPQLPALANNGGPTDTYLPPATSPALDAGLDGACPTDDQRGTSRPQGPHCDIGAVEVAVAPPPTFALTVAVSGSGSVSDGGSISCPGSCSASFASGTAVTLTATPAAGSLFSGWSGACSGSGSCVVTMSAAKSVTATFSSAPSSAPSSGPPAAPSPSVSIAVSPSGPTAGTLATLTATLAHSSATTVAYAWSFGDGTPGRTGGATITHRYQDAGSYTATVEATDTSTGTAIASTSTVVTVAPRPPAVGLSVNPGQPTAGSAALFLLEIPTGQAQQTTVQWSFGDGGTASGTTHSTTHTYAAAGTYTATVTETDTAGNTLSASKSIVVAPQTVGPADPNRSTVVADPPGALVQGAAPAITKSTIRVGLRDAWGRPVRNAKVKVTADSTTATRAGSASSVTTDSNGVADFTFDDHRPEIVHFTATDTTDGVTIAQTATVTFGPPAAKVSIDASPASLPAGSASRTTVTVTLTDAHGDPAPEKAFRLQFGRLSGVAPAPAPIDGTTGADGTATFTFGSLKAAKYRLSVYDVTDAKLLGASPPATVTFAAAAGGPASAATSTIGVDEQAVPADGSSKATITVTLLNAAGGAVPGTRVTLHTTSSLVSPSAKVATTDADGVATFTATATTAATATFTADDGADSLTVGPTPPVTFYLPVPDASTSSIVTAPTAEPADGTSASTVTVTLRDLGGKPVAGDLVALRATGSAVVTAISSISNSAGKATFHVADASNETVTLSAGIGIVGPSLVDTTLRFSDAIAQIAQTSTVRVAPAIVGDGGHGVVTVRLLAGQHPVAGKTVWLEADSSNAHIQGGVGDVTAANGVATFGVTDPKHETVTFTAIDASDGPLTIAQTASITFAPSASAAHSTIAAAPASVPADNTTKATVTVTLRDVNGDPAVGRTVKLVLSAGPGKQSTHAHSTGPVQTDANGNATFQVRDGTAETVGVSADDTDEGIAVMPHPPVTLSFSAPTGGAASASKTSVAAAPSEVLAASGRTSTVTVQLRNASGGAVSGKSVSLTASGGTSTISPSSATTGTNGTATFTVSDDTVETVTYRATDAADGITSTAGATVDFYKHAVDADRSTVTANTTPVEADGTSAATVVVTLLDPGGNPISGKHVVLHAGGSATVSPAGRTTDAHGQAVFHVTDATGETVGVAATDSSDRVALSATPAIVFKAVPSATASFLDVDLANVSTNGDVPAHVTVHLRDAHGAIVANAHPELVASSTHAQIDQISSTEFGVVDRQAETVTFTAVDRADGITVAQTVTVTFSAPAAKTHSFIDVSPASVPADGESTATVTATFETAAGVPAAGKVVRLVIGGVASSLTATTDANGEVTFTRKSLHAGTEQLAVLDVSDTKPGHTTPPVETPTVTLTFS